MGYLDNSSIIVDAILTKKGRMFDVGVLLLMVSVLMVFIEASK